MARTYFFTLLFAHFLALQTIEGQCDPFFEAPLSTRPANYDINVSLDDANKMLDAVQTVRFTNQSPDPIRELRFYLYFNAFKNTESSFLKGATGIFGQSFTDRKPDEWGWVDIEKLEREASPGPSGTTDLTTKMRFIQPDDGNPEDQSVLEVVLDRPIQPNETGVFKLKWRAQIPKTIARAGYSRDFFFLCHWFPQLGVLEKKASGDWGWNCHQFFRMTEFFADFGVYDVRITAKNDFVFGSSGCLVGEKNNGDGTTTRHFHAEDVIGFAWTAYPRFTVQEERWPRPVLSADRSPDVLIRLLIAPEHANLGERLRGITKFALGYLHQHVGEYPYPSITVIDPPFHGLRSGLMEYPTLITGGSFYAMPAGIRTIESLVVHEFVHQYFMGMVSSNEKEEAWLDEGFATYFEDRIIDAAFGEKKSLVELAGYQFGNRELSRLEYTTMANPRDDIVGQPGWEFSETNRKPLIYSKTATALRTVQALVGEQKMDEIVRSYFEKWKFKHPRGTDLMAHLNEKLTALPDPVFGKNVFGLFEKSIYGSAVFDYAVAHISNDWLPGPQGVFGKTPAGFSEKDGRGQTQMLSKVTVQRKGDWVFPVELLVTFEDGSQQTAHWHGEGGNHQFEFRGGSKIVSAQIDPGQKIGLDIDLNNNSMTLKPAAAPGWKYAAKATFWVQNLFQLISFLV